MPSKNDLSAYKVGETKALPKQSLVSSETTHWPASGRKAKLPAEKQSEIIALRFTPSEHQQIKDQAGMVPLGTYLRHAVFTQTDIFK